ncbi:hypothetical protein QBC43DRAFT_306348 [Cladorrhinum sp. PSN259]|nr:hypothetical protein QBC43DRAFT_306348 [Cladorrhinum sp. PSN259]
MVPPQRALTFAEIDAHETARQFPPHKFGRANTQAPFTGLPQGLDFNNQLEYVAATAHRGSVEEKTEQTTEDVNQHKHIELQPGSRPQQMILKAKDPKKQYLPSQPRIRLGMVRPTADGEEGTLPGYLRRYHLTPGLDDLLPWMRYVFVQTPSYDHIMPLHHQRAHAREIIVDEEPGLHLVWYYNSIFIKPIPQYFYSQAFWEYLRDSDKELYQASLGFMRSYYYLIRFEVDYDLACNKHKLVPKKDDGEFPTYEEWCEFINPFSLVGDDHVNRRYHYGELRLSRINRTTMLFKWNLAYFHLLPQWGSFLSHILAPLITAFAVCSVILNSMQVTLASIEVSGEMGHKVPGGGWENFLHVCLYYPLIVILLIALVMGAAMAGICFMGLKDLLKGNMVRQKKKNGELNIGRKSHGMIW